MPTYHMTTLRRPGLPLAGVALIAALALATGCGKKDTPADTAGATEAAAEVSAEAAAAKAKAEEQEKEDRHRDAGNLKQLGLALLMYSGDYSGFFPSEAAILADTQTLAPGKAWVSPGFDPVTDVPASPADIRAGNTDYVYLGSGLKDDNARATNIVIMHTRDGAFDGKWINALFIDGHVEGVEAPDIQTAAEQKKWQIGK